MIFRRNHSARWKTACLALACCSLFSAPALAQQTDAAPATDVAAQAEAKPAEAVAPPAAPAPATEPVVPAPVAATAPPGPSAPPDAGAAGGFFGVEILPGSAYPEPHVRGLEGGSLWLTMPGLQWPYMPKRPGEPATRIGFSGSAWVDNSYKTVSPDPETSDPKLRQWLQQSRFVLRATPVHNLDDDWFVQGQVELVGNGDQTNPRPKEVVDTDDLWVRAGKWKLFDVTAGRFQGWELYHFGMGLDLNTFERQGAVSGNSTPVDVYGLTYFWDRQPSSGDVAVHLYPTDFLRFELLGQLGNVTGFNSLGVRPMGILDMGFVKFKFGAEYGKQTRQEQSGDHPDSTKSRGIGAALQFVLDPYVEFGVNVADGVVDVTNSMGGLDVAASTTTDSFGGFANARIIKDLLVGVGVNYTQWHDLKKNIDTFEVDHKNHVQSFGAIQYRLWQSLYLKAVVAHASAESDPRADANPIKITNRMTSARLRAMFLF